MTEARESGEARRAISELVYAYAERLDLGDFDSVAELLAEASYGVAGMKAAQGREQVRAVLERAVKLYDGVPCTKHVTTNLVVEIGEDGATASSRSYFSVLQAAVPGALSVIVAGRYHDRFARNDRRWRFIERVVHMDLVGDLSRHLDIDPATA